MTRQLVVHSGAWITIDRNKSVCTSTYLAETINISTPRQEVQMSVNIAMHKRSVLGFLKKLDKSR